MRPFIIPTGLVLRVGVVLALMFAGFPGWEKSWAADRLSEWVHADETGRLAYKALESGDRIMDFSFAGYMGGGVKIPSVPVVKTLGPSGGDDTAAIQEALDEIAKADAVKGWRGAVLLKPGAFECSATLAIKTGGVVLRGSGSGTGGTLIKMTGPPHGCVSITGAISTKEAGEGEMITDAYVPSGTATTQVTDTSGLAVGDTVRIRRPVTPAWVEFMGMDKLVRDGKKETWVSGETHADRVIKAISGHRLTFDIPLSDSLDAKYCNPPGASVVKLAVSGGMEQAGLESLRIVSPPQPVEISAPHYGGIQLNGVADAWVRDVEIVDTVGSVHVGNTVKRVTIANVRMTHTVPTKGAAKPADLSVDGTQVLFDRCSGKGDNLFYFVTGGRVTGPNVVLNCAFEGNGHIQPHMRWATGLLLDSCRVPESGVDLMNRGQMGSGHGWTIGWSVAWNCVAKSFVIQQPPGSMNWAIGCMGARETAAMPFGKEPKLPEGIFDSHGSPVTPASLYLAQLRERLGAEAVRNIGYP